jgi:choline dehydrogenase
VSQLRAESHGRVSLRSADPHAPPAIHYNYLATENDRQTMVDALKMLRKVVNTEPFSGYVAEERAPGIQVASDAQWLDYCRATGETVYHPTSTCRMGSDSASVVDERLRVRGVTGLRVIDASVMPAVISGNTNAAVIAIAEKGAELVLADARA